MFLSQPLVNTQNNDHCQTTTNISNNNSINTYYDFLIQIESLSSVTFTSSSNTCTLRILAIIIIMQEEDYNQRIKSHKNDNNPHKNKREKDFCKGNLINLILFFLLILSWKYIHYIYDCGIK